MKHSVSLVLEIVFESIQQKPLDKTILYQQVVKFVVKTSAVPILVYDIIIEVYETHLGMTAIINLAAKLLFLFCCIILISNQIIYPVKCNFVWTKRQNVWKMTNCWTLF